MRKHTFPAVALLAVLTACAGAYSPSSSQTNANVISRAEIDEAGPTAAYRLIESIRRTWLQTRGPTSFRDPNDASFNSRQPSVYVYLDGTRIGGPDQLRNLSTTDIEIIEFLNATRANVRFGPGHVNGAILVTSRTARN
jgi:hypothetical protein